MDKLNKRFMKDPKGFMEKYCIDVELGGGSRLVSDNPPPRGVYSFDLYMVTKMNFVGLRLANERTKLVGKDTNLIRAYWLPWASQRTTQLQLGSEANFFFTSPLGGCRVQVVGTTTVTGSRVPVVGHIAGDHKNSNTDNTWRRNQGAQLVRQHRGIGTRKFSSTQEYGRPREEALGFFAGYRNEKTGMWTFLGQKWDVTHDGYKLQNCYGTGGRRLWTCDTRQMYIW